VTCVASMTTSAKRSLWALATMAWAIKQATNPVIIDLTLTARIVIFLLPF